MWKRFVLVAEKHKPQLQAAIASAIEAMAVAVAKRVAYDLHDLVVAHLSNNKVPHSEKKIKKDQTLQIPAGHTHWTSHG